MKDQQAIQEETEKGSPPMMTIEEEILKEETEAHHMKTEGTEETEVTVETEEIMKALELGNLSLVTSACQGEDIPEVLAGRY